MITRTSALSFRDQVRRHHIHLRTGSYSGHEPPDVVAATLTFKTVQWTAFSALIRAIGVKTSNKEVTALGAILIALVVFFSWRAIFHIVNGIYRPADFKTKSDRRWAYAFVSIPLLVAFSLVLNQIVNIADLIVDYYLMPK